MFCSLALNAEYLENVQIPKDTKSDWMELKSGEWVRGVFKGFYSGKIEFDSDEFDLLKFDSDDVKQVVTQGESTINLNRDMPNISTVTNHFNGNIDTNHYEVRGKLLFKDEHYEIIQEDGTLRSIEVDQVSSIATGEATEMNYWSASVNIGVDMLSGNSEQVTLTTKAHAQRRTSLTRLRTDYLSTYTKVDTNNTTADNNRLTGSFDLYQTNHFYWRLASLEYIRDRFKNIKLKYTLGLGLGYDILYTDAIDWSVTIGPGYQGTDFYEVKAGEEEKVETNLVFFDTQYSHELSDSVDFILLYNMYLVNEKSGKYLHHVETTVETEFISDFIINISLFWDKVSKPAAFADGTYPEKDDFQAMLGVGYSY